MQKPKSSLKALVNYWDTLAFTLPNKIQLSETTTCSAIVQSDSSDEQGGSTTILRVLVDTVPTVM